MSFDEKVKFLRTQAKFKVVQLVELRAVAFAAKETTEPTAGSYIIGKTGTTTLTLEASDIEKIVRVYPDLAEKFK